MLVVTAPEELVLLQLKRTTGVAAPATGGLGSGHDVVSVSETSGPLEFASVAHDVVRGDPRVARPGEALVHLVGTVEDPDERHAERADDQRSRS